MNRREFSKLLGTCAILGAGQIRQNARATAAQHADAERPNFLWLSMEDISVSFGCYGDSFATTPNIDQLAARGVRFTQAYSVASVCSPSRACIITARYASRLGLHNHRSDVALPADLHLFPAYLRNAGYFCTNNFKCDYNTPLPADVWDENGPEAHWRHRKGRQPFFSVFNAEETHSCIFSQDIARIRAERTNLLKPAEYHDPAKVPLPPHFADSPELRERYALLYDATTQADKKIGRMLAELGAAGMAENTIVMCWGDNGEGGLHGKTQLTQAGLHVPLIVYCPPRWQHLLTRRPGEVDERLVTLMDLGSSVLTMAGIEPPPGQDGAQYLDGRHAPPTGRSYIIGLRDRFDWRPDFARGLCDGTFRYTRNFLPYLPSMQELPVTGMFAPSAATQPTCVLWQATRPTEELYDIQSDPNQLHNLADKPEYQSRLTAMREQLFAWMIETRDLGLVDEVEMLAGQAAHTPEEFARKYERFPLLLQLADAPRALSPENARALCLKHLKHSDAAARFWAVVGLRILGLRDKACCAAWQRALADEALSVRMAAADSLCSAGHPEPCRTVLLEGLKHRTTWVRGRSVYIIRWQSKANLRKLGDLLQALIVARDENLRPDLHLRGHIEATIAKMQHALAQTAQ
jgi:uncharacterized sulfatase